MGHRARELGGSKRHARGGILRLFTNLSFALRDHWASLWVAILWSKNCESLVLCSSCGYPAPPHHPRHYPPQPQHAHHHNHLSNHQRPHQGSSEVLRRCRGYSLPCRHWRRDGWRGGERQILFIVVGVFVCLLLLVFFRLLMLVFILFVGHWRRNGWNGGAGRFFAEVW